MQTLQRPLKSIIQVVNIYKIIFIHVTHIFAPSPGELFWVIICPFWCAVTFLIILYFLKTVQLLHIKFLRMFLVLFRGLPHLIKLFTAFNLYWELFWNILVLILESAYLFLRVVSHLIYEFLYSCFFYSSDYQHANKNSRHVSLCLLHYIAYFLYNPQIFEKLKSFLSIFHECLDLTVVVPLYGCYLSISYYVPEILGNHVTFWIWIFEILSWDMAF